MGYTFRVIFEGIGAYIPNEPFFTAIQAFTPSTKSKRSVARSNSAALPTLFQAGSPKNLQILLPDLRTPLKGSNLFIAPHFATLRVSVSDLAPGTDRDHQLVYRQQGRGEEVALYYLDTDDLTCEIGSAANRDRFSFGSWSPTETDPQDRPDPRYPNQVQSLFWLPRVSEVAPDFGPVREDLLGPTLAPNLAARIKTAGGFFRMHGFNLQGDRVTPRVWRFADPTNIDQDGVWNRAVGNRLALEFFQVEGPVRIRMENTRYSSESFVACVPPLGSGREVEVVISNVEPESLFAPERQVGDFDPDFDALYSLFEKVEGINPMRPVPNPSGVETLGAIEKPCVGGTR